MLDEEEGTESVDLESGECVVIGDASGGFLRMQYPGDAKGETERVLGKAGFAMRGGCCDGFLVYANDMPVSIV